MGWMVPLSYVPVNKVRLDKTGDNGTFTTVFHRTSTDTMEAFKPRIERMEGNGLKVRLYEAWIDGNGKYAEKELYKTDE